MGPDINDKLIAEYDEFVMFSEGRKPTRLILSPKAYQNLWNWTFEHWTRNQKVLHQVNRFCDCDIEIGIFGDKEAFKYQ